MLLGTENHLTNWLEDDVSRLMANGFIEVNFTVTSRGVQPASYDEVKEVLERYVGGQSDSQLGNLVVAGNSLLLEDRTDYSGKITLQ